MRAAGTLRHYVTFEDLVIDIDSDGAQDESWFPAFGGQMISADITALSGKELIAAQGVHSKVHTRIKVRYRPEFKASMRVIHRGVPMNIEGIIPDPESLFDYVTLLCSSLGADEHG